jgi:hypothetical protein
MKRTIEMTVNNKEILVEKSERYINEGEIKEVIEDIIINNISLPENKKIDLSSICDSMFNILYRGIVTICEEITNKKSDVMIFEVS